MNRFERQEMYEKDHKVGKYLGPKGTMPGDRGILEVETVDNNVENTVKPRGRKKGDK